MQEQQNISPLLIMDGKILKAQILSSIKTQLEQVSSFSSIKPSLAIVFVGDDASSLVYIKQKMKAGEEIGIQVQLFHFNLNTNIHTVKEKLQQLNLDPFIHGIILQLPVPEHLNVLELIETIDPKKDVDGFHPINIGRASMGEKPYFYSATPLGTLKLLDFYKIETKGKNIVILNRSNIVGKPLANLLGSKTHYGNATVTICHSSTQNLEYFTQNADILISATSIPRFIKGQMIKTGSVLLDLGQAVEVKQDKRYIIGDMDFDSVKTKASAITPVPGGIGPMTVAILIENIFKAFVNQTNMQEHINYDFF